ncbi:uncharacterized protein [Sagmatias obliquidens]|uniref:uncharacterized protein n=1 Tax=Sagmatias obliquidens TaxID=3371155 RepID=UPI000F443D1D|nr:uncharacterized protein LOC113606693 [Lagenorhynchus obliquidens]
MRCTAVPPTAQEPRTLEPACPRPHRAAPRTVSAHGSATRSPLPGSRDAGSRRPAEGGAAARQARRRPLARRGAPGPATSGAPRAQRPGRATVNAQRRPRHGPHAISPRRPKSERPPGGTPGTRGSGLRADPRLSLDAATFRPGVSWQNWPRSRLRASSARFARSAPSHLDFEAQIPPGAPRSVPGRLSSRSSSPPELFLASRPGSSAAQPPSLRQPEDNVEARLGQRSCSASGDPGPRTREELGGVNRPRGPHPHWAAKHRGRVLRRLHWLSGKMQTGPGLVYRCLCDKHITGKPPPATPRNPAPGGERGAAAAVPRSRDAETQAPAGGGGSLREPGLDPSPPPSPAFSSCQDSGQSRGFGA